MIAVVAATVVVKGTRRPGVSNNQLRSNYDADDLIYSFMTPAAV